MKLLPLELVKNNAVENIKNGQAVTYYGKLNDKIICQATAMFDEDIIQNSDGLVGTKTVYLCNFSTDKKHQGKGYFSKLFKFVFAFVFLFHNSILLSLHQ